MDTITSLAILPLRLGAIVKGSDVIGNMGSKVASSLRGPFSFLLRLAWESRIRLPVLITVAFMVLDVRMQLEINVNLAVRRIPMIVVEPDISDVESDDDDDIDEDDDADDESSECSYPTDGTASDPLESDDASCTSLELDTERNKLTEADTERNKQSEASDTERSKQIDTERKKQADADKERNKQSERDTERNKQTEFDTKDSDAATEKTDTSADTNQPSSKTS